ncbi:transcription factor bHLH118-like [Abrus precatorius]|uniref:Transcription factor bHLH118-like n=1 Tax=Abrus precatorius TaxID=3816 RepID=A0A8B8LUM9_ABRPR|nr:transcription factor bHLH118-like [Abrus precatorius]
MFPLQRGNELVIQFSNSPHQQQHKISEDLILDDYASLDVNYSDKKFSSSHPKKCFNGADKNHGSSNEHKKKMIHREIERQRRQEMATFIASLRSLLPLEFIKGKRSISDHMSEAVNYIKHMQHNIKELGAKRDKLKKLSNYSKMENNHETLHTYGNFTVHENNGIVGIEITSGFRKESFKLSKLLQLLIEEGLEVVSCLSTEANGRLLHSVQCEVNDSNSVDLSELRRKVANVIPTHKCFD